MTTCTLGLPGLPAKPLGDVSLVLPVEAVVAAIYFGVRFSCSYIYICIIFFNQLKPGYFLVRLDLEECNMQL